MTTSDEAGTHRPDGRWPHPNAMVGATGASMTTSQPNILMIMADQLTAPVLSCYGGSAVKARHIERLAREGVLFERAYCNSPLCGPSRASMMAGRLPSKIGAYDNAAEFAPSVTTVAHGLRAQGYWTCLCGKMHFIGPDQLHGFEDRLTPDIYPADFGWTPDWDHPEERIDWWYHNMLSVKQAGIAEATNQLDFDDEVGFHALRFLKDYARVKDRRPFFLVVSFTHPHDPYATREAYWNRYADGEIPLPRIGRIAHDAMDPHSRRLRRVSAMDEADITEDDVRRARRAYFGSIAFLDERLGEIMATLSAFGLEDDTIVVFTSDHGDLLGERGLWYKMCFFEWAVRVPLICHAPRRFAPRRAQTLVSLVDLMPTLLELGRPAPDVPVFVAEELDGSSLVPLLAADDAGERTVCGEYLAEGALAPIFMIRRGSHKFIWSEPDPPLLFDLASDPDELDNLAAHPDHAEKVRALEAEVRQHWQPDALYRAVVRSQRARRIAFQALSSGQRTPWDFRPGLHRRHYVAGAADLNDLERVRRFPPAPE